MKVMEMKGMMRRERRDWLLIVLILPLGTLLMFLAGQQAVETVSSWSVQADMASHLNPGNLSNAGGAGLIEPLREEIGTPAAWLNSFLTPQPGQDNGGLPPLVIFDPSATPSPTVSATVTVTSTPTTSTPTATTTVTGTPPTATATKTKTPKPPTNTPTASPTTATPTASPTTPSPTPTASPTTIDPSLTPSTPPPGATVGPPDGNIGEIPQGSYFLLDISGNPIIVNGPTDTNYDMVYYESDTGTNIQMDQVIVGITNDTLWLTYQYYEVFNWGNGVPDTNSNVDTTTLVLPSGTAEPDNEFIQTTDLYGTDPQQSGILIDVDNAPDPPPPDTYNLVVIISPVVPPQSPPGDATAQLDSIDVVDVTNP